MYCRLRSACRAGTIKGWEIIHLIWGITSELHWHNIGATYDHLGCTLVDDWHVGWEIGWDAPSIEFDRAVWTGRVIRPRGGQPNNPLLTLTTASYLCLPVFLWFSKVYFSDYLTCISLILWPYFSHTGDETMQQSEQPSLNSDHSPVPLPACISLILWKISQIQWLLVQTFDGQQLSRFSFSNLLIGN